MTTGDVGSCTDCLALNYRHRLTDMANISYIQIAQVCVVTCKSYVTTMIDQMFDKDRHLN